MDRSLIEREFPQDGDLVYLNHAGIAPWPARTARAIGEFAGENVRAGGRHYEAWLAREAALREQLRSLVNAPAVEDIALLKNTSEALSVVACGIDWRWGDNVVGSDEEFPSNRIPWQAQRKWGVGWREVGIRGDDPEAALMAACDDRTRLLTVSSVQYASGIRMDLPRLGRFCRERGILFCVDAIQSIGAHGIDVQAAHADFLMADGHKWMLGPEGIALFYCRGDLRHSLELRQFGWRMVEQRGDFENRQWRPAAAATRFECGSPNMLGIFGLGASLSLFEELGMEQVESAVLGNAAYLIENLEAMEGIEVATPVRRHAGIVCFRLRDRDPVGMHRTLVDNGVICALRGGGLRFSPHFYNSRRQLDKALEIISSTL